MWTCILRKDYFIYCFRLFLSWIASPHNNSLCPTIVTARNDDNMVRLTPHIFTKAFQLGIVQRYGKQSLYGIVINKLYPTKVGCSFDRSGEISLFVVLVKVSPPQATGYPPLLTSFALKRNDASIGELTLRDIKKTRFWTPSLSIHDRNGFRIVVIMLCAVDCSKYSHHSLVMLSHNRYNYRLSRKRNSKNLFRRPYKPVKAHFTFKGGDPAAPSDTATLLRLHPSHRFYLRQLPPCG